MAGKIDYKEYLKQFGQIETDSKNRIKAYLEEQIKEDAALKELYRPEKIDDCYNFIKDAVKATGCGSSAAIEDAVIFKMARDFYLDYAAGAETATEAETEAETELTTEEEKPEDNENSGTPCEEAESENEKPAEEEEVMLHQADNEGEESEESESSEAETESVIEEEKPKDNENEAVTDEYGFEIFGEEKAPEASAETAASEETNTETKAEPENEKPEPFHPKYDEDGNGLLFDI